MSHALLIVDIQNDFTEGGALGVDGGDAVARGVTAFLASNAGQYSHIFASRDWHSASGDNGGHFSSSPDFIDTWPVHCVAETEGAAYHPALNVSAVSHHIRKGHGEPAYSAFEGVLEDGVTLEAILRANNVAALDIVGIATDHCVRASAQDALRLGLQVRIFTDLIAGVNADASVDALRELSELGADLAISGAPA